MPNVTNFVFCEDPRLDDDKPKAINFLQTVEAVAGNFSFGILYSITGFAGSEDHNLYVSIFDPKGEKIFESERFFLEREDLPEIEGERLVTGISMGIEFKDLLFEGQGLYKVGLVFDDDLIGEFFIPVLAQRGSDE